MARDELEKPAIRVGVPEATDIISVTQQAVRGEDGSLQRIDWQAKLWFRDADGLTTQALLGFDQYTVSGTYPSYPVPPATIVAGARAKLVSQGFAEV